MKRLLAALPLAICLAADTVAEIRPTGAVLIGWDGVGRDSIKAGLEGGRLPVLKHLVANGSLVALDILRDTSSKPGWAQILTGYNPEVSGVYSAERYQPIPAGYTIFERLEARFGRDVVFTGAVMNKRSPLRDDPPRQEPVREIPVLGKLFGEIFGPDIVIRDGGKYRIIRGQPYYNARRAMDVFINGMGQDRLVAEEAVRIIGTIRCERFFLFVHFGEPDLAGHEHGGDSPEYRAALEEADFCTGIVLDALEKRGILGSTRVYITSDHGFPPGEKNHKDAPYVFLASNDPRMTERGDRVDVAPTILEGLGIETEKIEPPLDGHPLTRRWERLVW